MARVVILGAGGHAQVVADILLRAHEKGANGHPIGFLDDHLPPVGTSILGLPILGTIAQLDYLDYDAVVIGIGDNGIRARLFEAMQGRARQIVNAIHPAAVLAPDLRLGTGVVVAAGVVVNTGSVIGDNVILNTGCTVDHHNHVGSHAHVAPGVHLAGGVWVGEGALIGVGTSVIPGRSIGEWAIVGAGSVVTRDIPPFSTAVGAPARVIKQRRPER